MYGILVSYSIFLVYVSYECCLGFCEVFDRSWEEQKQSEGSKGETRRDVRGRYQGDARAVCEERKLYFCFYQRRQESERKRRNPGDDEEEGYHVERR